MKQVVTILIFGLLFSSCSFDKNNTIESILDDYYSTYKKRKDIDKFIEYYDNYIVLEDIINGDRIEGKSALRNFLDWENPNFKVLGDNSLTVTEEIIDINKAVVKGYFTKFQWGEYEFESMHFTTILIFNESGKIIKQVDWINYPNTLVDYNKRKNSNEWIK